MNDNEVSRRQFLVLGAGTAAAGFVLVGCGDSGGGKSGLPPTSSAGVGGSASGSASAPTSGTASAQCVLSSNVTQGPYYLDKALVRQDITEGKPGVPLKLRLTVQDTTAGCNPVPGAAVEVWHCDAWGYYSGFVSANPGGSAPAESADTSGANDGTYLRGYQVAGADGVVEFTTIVPGWYMPRVTHIHVKVHTGGQQADGTYVGGKVNFTGQLFFEDAIGEAVYKQAPYNEHTGTPTKLADDMVYQGGGAKDGLMTVTPSGTGYVGVLTLGIDPAKENSGASGGGSGGGAPGGPPPR
ncbi:intradiol ring-cleavage dioxygenase [Yinghuangia seranimata]|uniref:intradiol ring-cleavage dioxygenase n=1 Tax=Yinghuangia seranimata TaxID=408067 RepID=UPI00248C6C44|nr:intradiol ring-cleavage dioxygenase [Yinghuangia seranimata]MDI2129995.1 intradiol ring-cleavage dioxygenase [Yinghuangia seranimata]